MKSLNGIKQIRLVLAVCGLLIFAAPVYAEQSSIVSAGVSSQSINMHSTAPQHTSAAHVAGGQGLTGPTSFSTSHAITEVKGNPTQTIVGAPETKGTFVIEAEVYRPDPSNAEHPFQTKKQPARMPDLSKKEVFWTPNQKTVVFNR